ncbi:unnamed protein product [Didymodactylos carnosus]|uniref:Uncharacterized protein n=1 Tax=Didymodactylos carnosus TaxID=1234261 RepID=A0A813T513_9BILA|nr:unnamed protein product [Didymodactylos carnosus]CAF0804349.1 unnamed protein product [Didymodactylos carnosus]CAF3556797.1 unnamed protein product [Didymodactylos carnosus]CAF3589573.1 unnamed protein product [Didymodactylos carnosus]
MSPLALINFLTRIGFSDDNGTQLVHHLGGIDHLMTCSNRQLAASNVSLYLRIRLIRAIKCFHMEKWSKHIMLNFKDTSSFYNIFEKLIYQLLKVHCIIIYYKWTLGYIQAHMMMRSNNMVDDDIEIVYQNLVNTRDAIQTLHSIITLTKKHLS